MLEKRWVCRDLINAYKYLKDGYAEDGPSLFSEVPSERMQASWQKLEHKKFHLKMRKTFFSLRVARHQNRLPRDVVESPSLQVLKTLLDTILCGLL